MHDRRSLVLGLATGLAAAACTRVQPVPERAPYLASPGTAPSGAGPRAGLLLPFTGPQAELGRALMDAARQALAEVEPGPLVLVPEDTLPDAAAAARRAAELGCTLLIGPLTSAEAAAAGQAARPPLLALSNDTSIGRDGLWPLGIDPEAQAARVVSLAATMGRARLGAVVPEDPYGARLLRGIEVGLALRPAGVLAVTITHPSGRLPAAGLAERLAGLDAVLVGAGGGVPAAVAAELSRSAVPPRLLGTLRWLQEPAPGGAAVPAGAWIALPDPAAEAGFARRYEQHFNRTAPSLALLVADAVGVAAVVARGGGDSAGLLTRPEGFTGLLGSFRLTRQGRVERLLAVVETRAGGGFEIIDPAPAGFAATAA